MDGGWTCVDGGGGWGVGGCVSEGLIEGLLEIFKL